jgi:hypothetical protein
MSDVELELDALYDAIRHGRLDVLQGATDRLSVAVAHLGPDDAGRLERIRRKAARNEAGLLAAARGVRAARRRLAEIAAMDAGFLAYGPDGKRDGNGPSHLTQRL